ncbi:MAG TPA: hypothetical protein DCF63_11670, partial [Planctomycetaceae bacterium]|nr:hypothetical protein [Planctomycetaceae bacterium]
SPFAGIQYLPISVAPIGPGRVCIVGSFGRAWIALVEVLPTGGTKVELIHEAREVFQPEDRKAYRNANVGFAPMLLETLVDPSDAKASPKVLIWRHEMEDNGAIVRSYPLLVDPEEKRAIVPNEAIIAIRNDSKVIGVQDDAIFQIKPHPISREIILVRHQLPKLDARVIAENTPQGLIRVVENELHIIGQKWWTIDLNQPSVRERAFVPWDYTDPFRNPKKIWVLPSYVAEPPPKEYVLDEVFTSSHYGFLVNVRERMDGQSHVLTWPRTMIASLLPLTASDSDD